MLPGIEGMITEEVFSEPFPYANTIFVLTGEGGVGNTQFPDESAVLRGFGARNGNVSIVASPTPYVGSGTIAFDGSGDWLEWPDHADFTLGVQPFALVAVVSFTAAALSATVNTVISHYNATTTQRGWHLAFQGVSRTLSFVTSSDGSQEGFVITTASFNPVPGQFYFILVTRDAGSVFRMHVGPVSAGAAPLVARQAHSVSIFNSNANLMVGRKANTSPGTPDYLNGHINYVALVAGATWLASDNAVRIPDSLVTDGAYEDPFWPWVTFLSGFEAANGAAAFSDEGPYGRAITTVGNAQATTTDPLAGSSSLMLDGGGDYLTLANANSLQLASGSCFYEARIKLADLSHQNTIYCKRTADEFSFFVAATGALHLAVWNSGGGVVLSLASAAGAILPNVEYAVAFSRQGSNCHLFIDGVVVASGSLSGTPNSGTAVLNIGRDPNVAGRELEGRADEMRITRVARHIADYTPSSGPLPRG